MPVRELRLVLTVDDLDAAVAFYRDGLGLEQVGFFENDGRVTATSDSRRRTGCS